MTPRETVVLSQPGSGTLNLKRDYPWVVAVRACVKGADADGGEAGYVLLELYDQPFDSEEDR